MKVKCFQRLGKIQWFVALKRDDLGPDRQKSTMRHSQCLLFMQSICFFIIPEEITLTFSEGNSGTFFSRTEKPHSLDAEVILLLGTYTYKKLTNWWDSANAIELTITLVKNFWNDVLWKTVEMAKKAVTNNAWEVLNTLSCSWKTTVHISLLIALENSAKTMTRIMLLAHVTIITTNNLWYLKLAFPWNKHWEICLLPVGHC